VAAPRGPDVSRSSRQRSTLQPKEALLVQNQALATSHGRAKLAQTMKPAASDKRSCSGEKPTEGQVPTGLLYKQIPTIAK
jgi:hypothetical protein